MSHVVQEIRKNPVVYLLFITISFPCILPSTKTEPGGGGVRCTLTLGYSLYPQLLKGISSVDALGGSGSVINILRQ